MSDNAYREGDLNVIDFSVPLDDLLLADQVVEMKAAIYKAMRENLGNGAAKIDQNDLPNILLEIVEELDEILPV